MELRRALRKANGDYMVSKKTLIARASKETGFDLDKKILEGEVGVAFAPKNEDNILAISKEVANFAKKNAGMLKILGGIWNGVWADIEQVKRLASIPPREILLTQLAFILSQPVAGLARVLNKLSETKGQ